MAELYLVRHAQASFGTENYDRLSELGRQQSRWLGEWFRDRGVGFDAVVSGGMTRHRETAELITQAMDGACPPAEIDSNWDEFDFEAIIAAWVGKSGAALPGEGASRSTFSRLLRDALLAWSAEQLDDAVPEPWAQFEQRVGDALQTVARHSSQPRRVLVVSSGGAIAMALRQVLEAPPAAMVQMNLQVRNTSISQLFCNARGMHFAGFNHLPHLDGPGRAESVTYY